MQIMGILNVTPDSFSDGGNFFDVSAAVEHTKKMIEAGADIIDIGGESSRPGSSPVSVEEELRRVIGVIQAIRKESKIPISIDTTKSLVALRAVEAGATIINDISAGRFDPEMFSIAASTHATICLMHMQGSPKTMQENPYYENVVQEVKDFLREQISLAQIAGIQKEKIIIDPGFGFGKRLEDNLALLNNLNQFADLGFPILVGLSRKSFIGALTGAAVADRLPGSLVAAAIAVSKGAQILRVHDVYETRRALSLDENNAKR